MLRLLRATDTKAILEDNLYLFLQACWPVIRPGTEFVGGPHLVAIADHLQAVTERRIRRLVVNVPYRTSKSTLVNVVWPAWSWTHDPTHQWLCVSHNEKLAIRDTRDMRFLIESAWYQSRWPMGFARDQSEKKRFENDQRGHRIAAGLGAGILGESADTIVLDDPIDATAAKSELERENVNEAIDQKLLTRLNDPKTGCVVLIMQRLHECDPSGHLLAQGNWEHLMMPMEFESTHPHLSNTSLGFVDWRTQDGELLCPERFPREWVEQEKARGEMFAAGQLQQRPAPREGAMFKRRWFNWAASDVATSARDGTFENPVVLPPKFTKLRAAVDTAASEGEGDYSAMVLLGEYLGKVYILDVLRGQWSAGKRNTMLLERAKKNRDLYGARHVTIEREPGAGGKEAAENLQQLFGREGFSARLDNPQKQGPKEERADPLAGRCEMGDVYIHKAPWNADFLHELCVFPMGAHDDCVDAAAAAYNKLSVSKRMMAARSHRR